MGLRCDRVLSTSLKRLHTFHSMSDIDKNAGAKHTGDTHAFVYTVDNVDVRRKFT